MRERARRSAHDRAADGAYGAGPPPPDLREHIRASVYYAAGAGGNVQACLDGLLGARLQGQQRLVDSCVDELAAEAVGTLVVNGWTPVDLYELARRRLDDDCLGYVLDTLAAVTSRYGQAAIDPRWRAQLSQLDAHVWWRRDAPHLGQWAARAQHDRRTALGTAIGVLGLLRYLPRLAELLPPPGSAASGSASAQGGGVDAKMLAKVRALLAKAESSEFDDEAEALSAKAQELMSRYALHAAVEDADRGATQHAAVCRIWLDAPYVTAKSLLVNAVAGANRCQSVLAESLGCVTLVGDERDLRFVELLTTSLLIQATRAMVGAGSHTTRSGVSRTRSFRRSFLVAYAGRIRERLHEATHVAERDEDAGCLLPVLAARRKVVEDTVSELFPSLVSRPVSVSNAAGLGAGRAAADQARFDVHESIADQQRAG